VGHEPTKPGHESQDEEIARSVLLGIHPAMRFGRRFFRSLPSSPRCKLCHSPFTGAGGRVMRMLGKEPWPKNPKYCSGCFKQISQHRTGAEIECSLLFADVRGSTTLAEHMRPAEFRGLMNRFFELAAHVLIDHDAIVDKFVGDEVIGIFVPVLTGENHARPAIEAAQALLAATRDDGTGGAVPVGAGVHTGVAFVGTVGEGDHVELTAMGDPVNVTARLASAAGAGEVLVTLAAAQSAGISTAGLEHRDLALKGKSEVTEVVVLGPSTSSIA
jgi:adenylate cyclase